MDISVVMGVYNPIQGQLLEAVQSILDQTVQNWEMILYDDGSNEEGAQVVQETAQRDPRIVLVRGQENRGLAYALNQCVKLAKGRYLARMDADDRCLPHRFAEQMAFLDHHPEYQWVGSNAELFDYNGVWGEAKVPERPDKNDFLKFSPYIHPAVMFRRELFSNRSGYIPAQVTKRCEDYELFMRLHSKGYRGYNLQEPLFMYREDQAAYGKRKFLFRWNEMKIRYRGFKRLGILRIRTLPYVFRPVVGGVIPVGLVSYVLRRNQSGSSGRYEKEQVPKIQQIAKEGKNILP